MILVLSLISLWSAVGLAQIPVLEATGAARTVALGGAVSALDDLGVIWENPSAAAGLASLAGSLGGHFDGLGGSTAYGIIGRSIGRNSLIGAIAVFNGGTLELIATDGNLRTLSAGQDVLGAVGTTRRWTDFLRSGITLKAFHSKFLREYSITGYTISGAVQADLSGTTRAGLTIGEVGPPRMLGRERVSLPGRLRLGAAHRMSVFVLGLQDALVVADLDTLVDRLRIGVKGGTELGVTGPLAVRLGGYSSAEPSTSSGATMGIACRVGRIAVNYAIQVPLSGSIPLHAIEASWTQK